MLGKTKFFNQPASNMINNIKTISIRNNGKLVFWKNDGNGEINRFDNDAIE